MKLFFLLAFFTSFASATSPIIWIEEDDQQELLEKCVKGNIGCQELCDRNIGVGCYWRGVGELGKGNIKVAKDFLKKGCENGSGRSCNDLSSIIKNEKDKELCGKGNSVHCMNLYLSKKDRRYLITAKKELQLNCKLGYFSDCDFLARLEEQNGEILPARVSLQKAKFILQKKCDKFDMNGCLDLANMILETEYDLLEVKHLLERACYYFQHNLACEKLTDFEEGMGLGDPNGEHRVCEIVGDWCSPDRGKNVLKNQNFKMPETRIVQRLTFDLMRSEFSFYQRLIYQMNVQDWIPRGLTIIPLEMEGWGRHVVY
jgi:hypothetical protein